MILTDAHAHLGSENERAVRRRYGIKSYLCVSTPEEAHTLISIIERNPADKSWIFPAFGLHPWYADKYSSEEMLSFLEKGIAVGEIGLDTVWCEVPLKRQEEVFEEQLELAGRLNKPVILHTKGQEERIAQIIRHYPNRYLVHWYSSMEGLRAYQEQDCYFTVGPDVNWNLAVKQVLADVDKDRLLIETDGYSAVLWCMEEFKVRNFTKQQKEEKGLKEELIVTVLKNSLESIAKAKNISIEETSRQLEENRIRLFK